VVTPDAWRGVAAESAEEVPAGLRGFLRGRSRSLLSSLLRPHRRPLLFGSVLVVAETAAKLAGPFLVQRGIDRGIPPLLQGDEPTILLTVVGVFLAVVLVRGLLQYLFLIVSGRIGQDVLVDLRNRLFDHFQRLSLSFHERYTSGRVISRLTSDVEAISELLGSGLLTITTGVLSIVGISTMLMILDPFLGAVALAMFPVVICLTVWFRRRAEVVYRQTREAVALVIIHFVESLGGIRAVQAFRREPRNQDIFDDVNGRYAAANLRSNRLAAVFGPGVSGIGRVTVALVLLVGAHRVVAGDMTVGVLAAFLLYTRRFFEPMQDLSQFYNLFQAAVAALEKLSGVLDERPDVTEPARPVELGAGGRSSSATEAPAGHEVRLDAVRFAYRTTEVLHGLDLTIPAGQTVALVGATGAGKSTVARLVARFYDPTGGQVLLDGVDVRELADDTLRRCVITVTQESHLFSGTVAENILLGKPDATRQEAEEAAQVIGADRFLASLPEGYDTEVRTRGARLSAGERQLVAFARAFLADPGVLVLDEATSSLDLPSERLVQRALRVLLADRTAVIIAHRLSTVEIADRVLVMVDGSIVEDGSPIDLLGEGGHYRALHQAWAESLV
jgi:ABC-type multidrug transport system fused ATPase/permease subunit